MILCADPLAQFRAHDAAIRAAVMRVLENGNYILGKEVETFEQAFADYLGSRYAVGVGNGTDALILALRAMGIGRGDEVITVSHTAIATVAAILATGATPVLVDIDPILYTIDPAGIEAAITKRSKAIIAVHLYGQAADMKTIMSIARRHGLKVIEDCAQATGGMYGDKRLGTIGHAGTFSFYPTKNLGAIGDGGLIATNDKKLAERVTRLRQYGWNASRETREPGLNSRLDSLQAAILGAKLPAFEADNDRRIAIAARYTRELDTLKITTPAIRQNSKHVYHLYVVACHKRDQMIAALKASGIAAGIHYPRPAHRHNGYGELVRLPRKGLPVTNGLVRRILSLPMYPELSDSDVGKVIDAMRAAILGKTG